MCSKSQLEQLLQIREFEFFEKVKIKLTRENKCKLGPMNTYIVDSMSIYLSCIATHQRFSPHRVAKCYTTIIVGDARRTSQTFCVLLITQHFDKRHTYNMTDKIFSVVTNSLVPIYL